MPEAPAYAAIDLGAESGRVVLGRLGGGRVELEEVHRFDNRPGRLPDGLRWNLLALFAESLRGLGLFHGKRGGGVSVEFKVKNGPITILGCTQTADGRLKFIAAEGESLPGPTFRIGNTNSRLRFSQPPAEFFEAWCEHGPTHHVALGVGHVADEVVKLAALLGLDSTRVA